MDALDSILLDWMIAPARETLPEPAVAVTWETGRSMGLEQAVELALTIP